MVCLSQQEQVSKVSDKNLARQGLSPTQQSRARPKKFVLFFVCSSWRPLSFCSPSVLYVVRCLHRCLLSCVSCDCCFDRALVLSVLLLRLVLVLFVLLFIIIIMMIIAFRLIILRLLPSSDSSSSSSLSSSSSSSQLSCVVL